MERREEVAGEIALRHGLWGLNLGKSVLNHYFKDGTEELSRVGSRPCLRISHLTRLGFGVLHSHGGILLSHDGTCFVVIFM